MLLLYVLVLLPLITAGIELLEDDGKVLAVECPSYESPNKTLELPLYSPSMMRYLSSTKYCTCSMAVLGSFKTVIIKCDFEFEEDIILDDSLFPFKKYNISSAYVRMTNTKSAHITSKFLSTWMDSPSSALDLWHCGKVIIESAPVPLEQQIFPGYKTFIGVGIIDCNIEELPGQFLRDRNRGAIRLKECHIGKIQSGLLHNIEEMRYMIMEDTVIDLINSPLSSSGVIALSKKEIHAWDGMELINTTFKHITPNAFNITHKDDMEKLVVKNCHFGNLEQGGLTVSGDINVAITNSSFSKLDSFAIQISINGLLSFTSNIIEDAKPDSLYGITCREDASEEQLLNNTIYMDSTKKDSFIPFKNECGTPTITYLEPLKSTKDLSGTVSSVIALVIIGLVVVIIAIVYYTQRTKLLIQYRYKRNETLLCRDDQAPDGEENCSDRKENEIEKQTCDSFRKPITSSSIV